MEQSWERDGVLVESMTEEEWAAGGTWVIGDQRPKGHPGKNDGSLLVKSWVALPDRYGGEGHGPRDRVHENRWEFVKVLSGRLDCLVQDGHQWLRFPLIGKTERDAVELPPDSVRRWQLPEGQSEALGITLCRRLRVFPVQGGIGDGYEFFSGEDMELLEASPVNLTAWRLAYLEVVEGSFLISVPRRSGGRDEHVSSGGRVFLREPQRVFFSVLTRPLRGVGLFIR